MIRVLTDHVDSLTGFATPADVLRALAVHAPDVACLHEVSLHLMCRLAPNLQTGWAWQFLPYGPGEVQHVGMLLAWRKDALHLQAMRCDRVLPEMHNLLHLARFELVGTDDDERRELCVAQYRVPSAATDEHAVRAALHEARISGFCVDGATAPDVVCFSGTDRSSTAASRVAYTEYGMINAEAYGDTLGQCYVAVRAGTTVDRVEARPAGAVVELTLAVPPTEPPAATSTPISHEELEPHAAEPAREEAELDPQ